MVRVVKVDPREDLTLRRKWVCLPGGGFEDDSALAPTWEMPGGSFIRRVLVMWGEDLLQGGDASVGAVAFEVEGGTDVLAHMNVMDVRRGVYVPRLLSFGQGQLIPAMRDPLYGPSHIPWLGGCRNQPCSTDMPSLWDHLRNNIGIVNPNPAELAVTGTVIPIAKPVEGGDFAEYPDVEPETFERVVPPYGWAQFVWEAVRYYGSEPWDQWNAPWTGFIISLTPDRDDLPYYAYASVVFTPDPDSGTPAFNDPMFVPAEPGYVAPFSEVIPPP
jgi:hypothetical protein